MSTKTTFKRIALVAVAALGLGTFSAIAPASAALVQVTSLSAGTTSPTRVGVLNSTTITAAGAFVSANDVAFSAQVISAPAGSAFATNRPTGANYETGVQATGTSAAAAMDILAGTSVSTTAAGTVADIAPATNTNSVTAVWTASGSGSNVKLNVQIQTDIAGSYTVMVSASATGVAGTESYAAGDKSVTYTFTTAGAPTTLTLASVAGSIIGGATYGKLFSLSLKDAAGNATSLGQNEALDVSDDITSTILNGVTWSGTIATLSSTSTNVINGVYYLGVKAASTSTADTGLLTVSGSGTLAATLTTNIAETVVAGTQPTATAIVKKSGTTGACLVATTPTPPFSATYGSNCSSHLFTVTDSNTAGTVALNGAVDVTTVSGLLYSTYYSVAAAGSTATLTITQALTAADTAKVNVSIPASSAVSKSVSYVAAAATASAVVVPASNILSATAGVNAMTVESTDQYGEVMQYQAVTVTVTGRNTVTSKSLGVTDANGQLTYTLTDAGTSGTSDSVVFTVGTIAASPFTITYGAVTVGTITITGGNTTASVANATSSTSAIEADDTPESAVVGGTVTVKDASGNLLAGVPVTFTVDKDGAAILSTKKTVYTGSAGTAATSVYAWKAGTYVVTATAGGKSTTASYTFANSRAADARVLSATADAGLVTAKVVDRFGNPVSGVTVYVSKTSGTGYFGTGVTKTSSTTGTDGTVDFAVTGTADIKVSTLDYAAVPGTNAAGQTCALAGNIDCAVGTTAAEAFTATTAGTATVAEENVGSTFAPAGVSSVTVSVNNNAAADNAQAATDAAAEATDAANAATDAANAAAEAADAATAAAQDAADAVAALSAQVASLISGLKSQLTALTNLVIKIQKKVKA
jgi:hypothetical protein